MSIAAPVYTPATLEDLSKVEGKAELIGGRIVHIMPHGETPGIVGDEILVLLHAFAKQSGLGRAHGDGIGYALPLPLSHGRQSFCPDVSFNTRPSVGKRMKFIPGFPIFAVEVRSENDYTPSANRAIVAKRADYFEAGTAVVWDVDPLAETVACYRAADPDNPILFHRGDIADAEPALPGWRVPVESLFA